MVIAKFAVWWYKHRSIGFVFSDFTDYVVITFLCALICLINICWLFTLSHVLFYRGEQDSHMALILREPAVKLGGRQVSRELQYVIALWYRTYRGRGTVYEWQLIRHVRIIKGSCRKTRNPGNLNRPREQLTWRSGRWREWGRFRLSCMAPEAHLRDFGLDPKGIFAVFELRKWHVQVCILRIGIWLHH